MVLQYYVFPVPYFVYRPGIDGYPLIEWKPNTRQTIRAWLKQQHRLGFRSKDLVSDFVYRSAFELLDFAKMGGRQPRFFFELTGEMLLAAIS